MRLEFGDDALERLAYEAGSTAVGWPMHVVRRFRRVLQMIIAATRPEDLEALLSLRVRPTAVNGTRGATLRIDDAHQLCISYLDPDGTPTAIIEAVEKH